jgi:putative solute:sodium symporter small subunit
LECKSFPARIPRPWISPGRRNSFPVGLLAATHVGETLARKSVSHLSSEQAKTRYWRQNLKWLGILLSIWFIVSYGCGILFVDFLDRYNLPGTHLKLGFWFAQQGSIYVFVILIAIYARVMNRLDRELLEGTDGQGSEAS